MEPYVVRERLLRVALGLSVILLCGCATKITVTPKIVPSRNIEVLTRGTIIYEGNREYLPRTISEGLSSGNALTLRYSYEETQQRDNTPEIIKLFNPLVLFGFPTGDRYLTVVGKLEILKGTTVVKSYSALCSLDVTRSLYSEGDSFSELHRKGLTAVRDSIETQMIQDKGLLENLSGPTP